MQVTAPYPIVSPTLAQNHFHFFSLKFGQLFDLPC
ncbi:MAG: hypothetical protein ACJAXQ_001347, partial [Parvibaculaceae bacterium]